MVTIMGLSIPARAAYPSAYVEDGFVEEIGSEGYVKGWVYQKDQALYLAISFVNTATSEFRTYVISNTQPSNKISYWNQRTDVQAYLNNKYKTHLSYGYPQGFMLRAFLPAGTWRLDSVQTQTIDPQNLRILPTNRIFTKTSSSTYNEGYVDTTTSGIRGWAYSSSLPASDYAPEIQISVSRLDKSELRTFTLPRGQQQLGFMERTPRQDVVNFLVYQRGQGNGTFDHPNGNRTYMGFTFSYSFGALGSGPWRIDSITADGQAIPFGNTNPSPIIYVPYP